MLILRTSKTRWSASTWTIAAEDPDTNAARGCRSESVSSRIPDLTPSGHDIRLVIWSIITVMTKRTSDLVITLMRIVIAILAIGCNHEARLMPIARLDRRPMSKRESIAT